MASNIHFIFHSVVFPPHLLLLFIHSFRSLTLLYNCINLPETITGNDDKQPIIMMIILIIMILVIEFFNENDNDDDNDDN